MEEVVVDCDMKVFFNVWDLLNNSVRRTLARYLMLLHVALEISMVGRLKVREKIRNSTQLSTLTLMTSFSCQKAIEKFKICSKLN